MNKNRANITVILFSLTVSFFIHAKDLVTDKSQSEFQLDFNSVTYAQWQETLEKYKGSVLVVDMWATWCISCLERFPHMVEMNKAFQNQGVTFVSLLLEDPEEPEAIENAKAFLIKQKADFAHYFMNENLMLSFDKLDLLGIPAVFIYDTEGQLSHRLTGDNPNKQFSEEDIKDALNILIEKNKN